MAKLLDLVESHPDVIVSIRAADLLAANEELIRRTRQELEQLITDANTETYPSAKKVAEMLDVDKLIMPENPNDDDGLLAEILASAERNDCEVVYISDRSQFELGNLGIKIWQPMDVGDENERGLIIQLNAGDYDMLVTGDASSSVERYLVSQEEISGVELLIAGHHGSRYSSCGDFLKYIGGETAIISTGYNTYGHPTYETLARLDAYGYNILRTDLNGNIEIRLG